MPDHNYTLHTLTQLDGDARKEALVALLESEDVRLFNRYREATAWQALDLRAADLAHTLLSGADLRAVDLRAVDLSHADLRGAVLRSADLRGACLYRADVRAADVRAAQLDRAELAYADLRTADLRAAHLSHTAVVGADFAGAHIGYTRLSAIDLSGARGLVQTLHSGPSTVGLDTFYASSGAIPRHFLLGCGVPAAFIEHQAYVIVDDARTYLSCFISYSHKDEGFARYLYGHMKTAGLRVWYAPEEMKMGGKIHEQLYEAIHLHDRFVLILSEHSINSNWVRTEIRRAYKRQCQEERQILFPISLMSNERLKQWEAFYSDDGVDLAQEIRAAIIGDFSQWKDHDVFQPLFEQLLAGLRTS